MPDWRSLTAERLAGLRLPEARREEIVQELSEHLEDEFVTLRQRLPEDVAQRQALSLLARSDVLVREIRKAEQEDPVTQTTRILLCGIVIGAVAFLFAASALAFFKGGVPEAVEAASGPAALRGPYHWLLHLAAGVWTIWLYIIMRPRYGSGTRTAALAGFALWLIGALAAATWASMGFIPPKVLLVAAVAGLPAWILGAMAGAWPYELTERKPAQPLKAS